LDITHNEHYQDIKQYYAAQLKGYELTLDAITKTTPISDVWVRSLHATICAPQKTYLVYTPVGWQEHELPKGDYKTNPNHVMGHDGKGKFSYSPVIDVVPEM
jgi:hypothetical protein